jgi:bifunctional NMN adenylyltransferase/nudix hydrolase
MLARAYPKAMIREHFDQPTNELWSVALDELIASVAQQSAVTLYGSRDSFIPHYLGIHRTSIVDPLPARSGTALRNHVREQVGTSATWRAGVIHAALNRLPILYGTVDIAVLRPGQVLLGKKEHDNGKLRFVGGFLDHGDDSDEAAASRELREEVGFIEVADWQYVGSKSINDWRYRGGPDGIMTRFFAVTYVFGKPVAGDDIDELHWVPRESVREHLVETHQPLGLMLEAFLKAHPTL